MKTAIFPGSFNPWHEGHRDILYKFDRIIIAVGVNPDKQLYESETVRRVEFIKNDVSCFPNVSVVSFNTLLVDFVRSLRKEKSVETHAIIRGLRSPADLAYEMVQQDWNEDLGLGITTIYAICDRNRRHISSSAIRAVRAFEK